MLRTGSVGGDIGQVDVGLGRRGQFDLGLFRRLLEALEGELVLLEVDAVSFLNSSAKYSTRRMSKSSPPRKVSPLVDFTSNTPSPISSIGHVEGAAAEVIDGDRAGALLVEAIGQRGRGRLVDDAQHFEAGDLAGVLGRLTLGVVEIGGNGDDRLGDRLAEIGFGGFLHLLQDEGGNLRRRILLAVGGDPGVAIGRLDDLVGDEAHVLLGHGIVVGAADQALDREKGLFRIGDRLALGRLAGETLAIIGKGDDRRCRARAFGVFDDLGRGAFHHRDAGIGGAEIDAYDFSHF